MQVMTEIVHLLPMLRRYARAVTGDQLTGDDCVAVMLERVCQRRCDYDAPTMRIALYRELAECFHDIGGILDTPVTAPARHMLSIGLTGRQAVLLTNLEGLTDDEAAQVLGLHPTAFQAELTGARKLLGQLLSTEVLIIEDEFFISRDLAKIVTSLGHRVIGQARTHGEARSAVANCRPGLVLADVQLADNSSGIDAVNEILASGAVPVIFITSFPERLLTGRRPEPTYIVSKPYQESEIRSIICQSLFFGDKAKLLSAPSGEPVRGLSTGPGTLQQSGGSSFM